jgi:hypothetical protein
MYSRMYGSIGIMNAYIHTHIHTYIHTYICWNAGKRKKGHEDVTVDLREFIATLENINTHIHTYIHTYIHMPKCRSKKERLRGCNYGFT